jgi:hypothetical protein
VAAGERLGVEPHAESRTLGQPHDAILGYERPALDGGSFGESNLGQIRWLAAEGEIFTEREVGITLPHEDAAQVWMSAKPDTHHVVNLTFVPICRPPYRRNGRKLGFLLRNRSFEANVSFVTDTV